MRSDDHHAKAALSSGTAESLVRAAIDLFGRKGFDGTSIREVARQANTNLASIAYHFGSKEGLRQACAEAFAAEVAGRLNLTETQAPGTPQDAEEMLIGMVETFSHALIAAPDLQPFIAFALREITEGGPGTDTIHAALVAPVHGRFCQLWALATGENAQSDATKLLVFSIIGQTLYFRIGAPIVQRRMNWPCIGATETDQIVSMIVANTRLLLAQKRRATP